MLCPSCKSSRVYRSRSKTVSEKAIRAVLPVHYFRCHECNWRGMRVRRKALRVTQVVLLGIGLGIILLEFAKPFLRALIRIFLS